MFGAACPRSQACLSHVRVCLLPPLVPCLQKTKTRCNFFLKTKKEMTATTTTKLMLDELRKENNKTSPRSSCKNHWRLWGFEPTGCSVPFHVCPSAPGHRGQPPANLSIQGLLRGVVPTPGTAAPPPTCMAAPTSRLSWAGAAGCLRGRCPSCFPDLPSHAPVPQVLAGPDLPAQALVGAGRYEGELP